MNERSKVDFWQFLRMVFVFFLGGTILSMFALQLSPSYRETTLELAQLRVDGRKIRAQFEKKEEDLAAALKKLQIVSAEAIKRQNEATSASAKKAELEVQLAEETKVGTEKAKIIEQMELKSSQTEKDRDLQKAEIDKLKQDNARLTKMLESEKKDFEAQTYTCEVLKSDAETCKVKHREVKNELERLTLKHEQSTKDNQLKDAECAKLKKKMRARDENAKKLVERIEQKGLENLLDPGASADAAPTIGKEELASLLKEPTGEEVQAATTAPVDGATAALVDGGATNRTAIVPETQDRQPRAFEKAGTTGSKGVSKV